MTRNDTALAWIPASMCQGRLSQLPAHTYSRRHVRRERREDTLRIRTSADQPISSPPTTSSSDEYTWILVFLDDVLFFVPPTLPEEPIAPIVSVVQGQNAFERTTPLHCNMGGNGRVALILWAPRIRVCIDTQNPVGDIHCGKLSDALNASQRD